MKLFFGEFCPDYENYHFPYQVWLLREEGDQPEKIYDQGFLPIRSIPNLYYLTRSVRVNLSEFELSSENRRIIKKTENLITSFLPLTDFNYYPSVQKFCKDYLVKVASGSLVTAATIRNIFNKGVYNQIFVWKEKNSQKDVGYAVCYLNDILIQYGHSFYDLSFPERSLGARMMLEAVRWAKDNNRKYAYLGTCYSKNALYKTEFKGIEFFNGFTWSDNLEELKGLIGRTEKDYLLQDKQFKEKFYPGNLSFFLSKYGVRVSFWDK